MSHGYNSYFLKLNIIRNRTFRIAHFLIENIHPVRVSSPRPVLGNSKLTCGDLDV